LKEDSGQLISQTKLDGLPVTAPIAITIKNERCILIGLDNGLLDVINLGGVIVLSLRLDAKLTASPVIVQSSRGSMLMLGTDAGLVALDATTLNPLWRVATSPDVPVGMLASSDLDSDGSEEVAMITRNGRIVVVNIGTGKIQWVVDSGTDANRVAFADMNGDGIRDVLVAGGAAFALGYSGKDGSLIWKADGNASSQAVGSAKPNPRLLIAGPFGESGSALLAGSDPGRTGLSAVGLPAGALK
jgi:outer membrane protein assembly factor BamB